MKWFAIATLMVTVLLFGWRYIGFLQVADSKLESRNSNQFCSISADCKRSGCNGDICGSGGGATICYPDPELASTLQKRQCSCLKNTCKWTKPIIGF